MLSQGTKAARQRGRNNRQSGNVCYRTAKAARVVSQNMDSSEGISFSSTRDILQHQQQDSYNNYQERYLLSG
jgi:hypothetical protein